MPFKITNNALVATTAGVILAAILGIFGYYITRPYVQYEEGQFYKTGSVAVASLRLENKGYFDAEQVVIQANFTEPITEITSGDAVSPLTVISGGKGMKTVVGTLPRIVPSQASYVYFAIDNSSGGVGEGMPNFIQQVTFKNGKGSDQPPLWTNAPTLLVVLLFTIVTSIFTSKYMAKSNELKEIEIMARKAIEESDKRREKFKKEMEEWERERKEYREKQAKEDKEFLEQLTADKAKWEKEFEKYQQPKETDNSQS